MPREKALANMKIESMRLDLQALNQVFQTRDVSMKYTFKTVPTNYIVWQAGLIPNFGCQTSQGKKATKYKQQKGTMRLIQIFPMDLTEKR